MAVVIHLASAIDLCQPMPLPNPCNLIGNPATCSHCMLNQAQPPSWARSAARARQNGLFILPRERMHAPSARPSPANGVAPTGPPPPDQRCRTNRKETLSIANPSHHSTDPLPEGSNGSKTRPPTSISHCATHHRAPNRAAICTTFNMSSQSDPMSIPPANSPTDGSPQEEHADPNLDRGATWDNLAPRGGPGSNDLAAASLEDSSSCNGIAAASLPDRLSRDNFAAASLTDSSSCDDIAAASLPNRHGRDNLAAVSLLDRPSRDDIADASLNDRPSSEVADFAKSADSPRNLDENRTPGETASEKPPS